MATAKKSVRKQPSQAETAGVVASDKPTVEEMIDSLNETFLINKQNGVFTDKHRAHFIEKGKDEITRQWEAGALSGEYDARELAAALKEWK